MASTAFLQTAGTSNPASLSSSSSSTHNLGTSQDPTESINPIHALGFPPGNMHTGEVHIVKVSGDTVQLEAGPVPQSFFHKVGRSIAHVVPGSNDQDNVQDNVGPPPPSPPASVEHVARDDANEEQHHDHVPPRMQPSKSEPLPRPEALPVSRQFPRFAPTTPLRAGPSRELLHRSSTDTKASFTTLASISSPRITRTSNLSDEVYSIDTPFTDASASQTSKSLNASHPLADGYLHPPPAPTHRPARRNTIGSAPRTGRATLHGLGPGSQPFVYEEGGVEHELASDIQLCAEQIRRERMTRRAKAQQEAEAALLQTPAPGAAAKEDENKVLVGNLIGEDHVNFVLMYNMLTGIRIGVSRCQAKIKRPLSDEDFTARHKFSFDIVGNELTPSAKYDFKFKDYAPWVFRELREDYFQLDPADYLLSLTAKYILSELGSPGKSGSFFYFSRDYRFIIKTIRHSEHKFLLSILKQYHAHVKNNPHTLLSRFYGLHRVKLPRGRKIHFVIMNNLFPPHRDIHETFDLKGSTVGRIYPEEKAAQNPRAVLKDLNWINRGKMLELGPEKRALITEQLRRDSELLKEVNVMDYSLLVGIHNMQRGNRDNVRRNTLKVFSPDMPPMRRKPTQIKGSTSPEAIAMRRAMRESDPKRLGAAGAIVLPEEDTGDRQHFIFYQDEGGLQATDEANAPMDTIYYLGVIDILTPYSLAKKCEHFWKGLQADRHKISPVPPAEYADRFFAFMKAIMRGGAGGTHFKSE